ncbi:hypothetical protein [Acinetobacter sp. G18]|uniref:hypothetical protein n=1 Tax=Acinetobacter sp. G18 TaxID=2952152 RepID=UPI0040441AC5
MKLFSIFLFIIICSSTYLHAEKLGKEKIEVYAKLMENYRIADQNLINYISEIHTIGQANFKDQMKLADLYCELGKAQEPLIEFMKLNKAFFGLKDEEVITLFPPERQKLLEELEEVKDTPYECGKQSYKHLL